MPRSTRRRTAADNKPSSSSSSLIVEENVVDPSHPMVNMESDGDNDIDIDEKELAVFEQLVASGTVQDIPTTPTTTPTTTTIIQEPSHKRRKTINNIRALEEALEDIELPSGWSFFEKLSVVSSAPLVIEDIDEDLRRESIFYQHALRDTKAAITMLDSIGQPYKRPADYFAEMVKSDTHMSKVKAKLLNEKKRMDAVSEKKKLREQRKFAKQVQVQTLQDRQRQKRQNMQALEKLRKMQKKGEIRVERSNIDQLLKGDFSQDKAREFNRANDKDAAAQRAKRKRKDTKFGFGGSKRYAKRNDKKSHGADTAAFDLAKNRSTKFFKGKRPGKAARQQRRGRN
jgi:rRNA-processing protein EBP2